MELAELPEAEEQLQVLPARRKSGPSGDIRKRWAAREIAKGLHDPDVATKANVAVRTIQKWRTDADFTEMIHEEQKLLMELDAEMYAVDPLRHEFKLMIPRMAVELYKIAVAEVGDGRETGPSYAQKTSAAAKLIDYGLGAVKREGTNVNLTQVFSNSPAQQDLEKHIKAVESFD